MLVRRDCQPYHSAHPRNTVAAQTSSMKSIRFRSADRIRHWVRIRAAGEKANS